MACNIGDVTNYADKGNAAEIPNNNTAGYTYKLCQPASADMLMLDQSFLLPGDSIVNVVSSVTDGTNTEAYSGAENFVFDTTALDLTKVWRIDYEIELASGEKQSAPAVFFDASVDAQRVGTSDPNCPPLSDKNDFLATGSGQAVCFSFVQGVASTTWNVAHNQGKMYPCGWSIINDATGDTMLGNVKPIDANNLQVIFGLALAGRITLTF
jgi:hypothetical protein